MKPKVSKALLAVWEMKQTVYDETKHLRGAAYFRYIQEEAARLFPRIGHRAARPTGALVYPEGLPSTRVAETRSKYGKRQTKPFATMP